MVLVYAYLAGWACGVCNPTVGHEDTGKGVAFKVGTNPGRWVGRWLTGRPTRPMIFKLFTLLSGVLISSGYINLSQYYRPLTGIVIGTIGVLMFAVWGISSDDLKD